MKLFLDIGCNGIKAAVIKKRSGRPRVLQDAFLSFDHSVTTQTISEALEKTLPLIKAEMDIKSCRQAVVYISTFYVYFKQVRFPFKTHRKISQVIDIELESKLPADAINLATDFVITRLPGSLHSVLSGSIDQQIVDTIDTFLSGCNISFDVLVPKQMALCMDDHFQTKGSSDYLFVCVDAQDIFLMVVYDGIPSFTRSFRIDGINDDTIGRAIHQTLLGFEQKTGLQINFEIFLTGIERGTEVIESIPGPVHLLDKDQLENPLFTRSVSKKVIEFSKQTAGNSMDFATALAKKMAIMLIFMLVALTLYLLTVDQESRQIAKSINRMDAEATQIFKDTFPKDVKILDPYLQMRANSKKILANKDSKGERNFVTANPNYRILTIIHELSKQIPGSMDIKLSRMQINPKSVVVSGSTDNYNSVDQLKNRILGSAKFQKVDIGSAVAGKQSGKVEFKFKIEM